MKDDLFDAARTPRPPADLKDRALRVARSAARKASATSRPRWGFNRFDLAWVATLLVLVLCHALVSLSSRPPAATSAAPQAIAEEQQLGKELGLKGPFVVAGGGDTGENGRAQKQLMQELERL
jgi:hypothetical protein